jgi:DNA-binding transcriptional LysR family regulator
MKIEGFFHELSVLSKAVAFSNLSSASRHVGLSQPQLSRIVKKIEGELGIQLLDREARRKSAWTRAALELADRFSRGTRELGRQIDAVSSQAMPREIRVATLEGLSALAVRLGRRLLDTGKFERVDLDVHDIGDLEEHFLRGHYDVIFSFREPGNRKFRFVEELGYQTLKPVETSKDVFVGSPFEARHARKIKARGKLVISNSLLIRREWLQQWGGHGLLPAEVHPKKCESSHDEVVLMVGAEELPKSLWDVLVNNSMR